MTVPPDPGREVTVFGGTGLVGGHVVRVLAGEPWVDRVRAPVRRPLPPRSDGARVAASVVDFHRADALRDVVGGSRVFLCLGTTMRTAGSREAFRAVDHDLTLRAARAALEAGARHAFLVSSVGADASSRVFYLRVKGEVENAVGALPFESVDIVRPAVLAGARAEPRPLERLGVQIGTLLAPLLVGPLRRQRPVAAKTVARAMVALARRPVPGRHVHESETLAARAG